MPIITKRSKWFPKRHFLAVTEVVTAKDGQVRSATIKTQHGIMVRPATIKARIKRKLGQNIYGLEDANNNYLEISTRKTFGKHNSNFYLTLFQLLSLPVRLRSKQWCKGENFSSSYLLFERNAVMSQKLI